jgi:hypothetical protein
MSRKFDGIDLMKLHALGSLGGWNKLLTEFDNNADLAGLAKTRYRIQVGMDDLVKAKLNTEQMNLFFIRLNRSLEETAKKIIRRKYPLPDDNPLSLDATADSSNAKKKRDEELQKFLKQSAY